MKHLACLKYYLTHKYYVFVAGRMVKAPLWNLIIHDWSKLLPSEWFAYAEYFHGHPKRGEYVEWSEVGGLKRRGHIVSRRDSRHYIVWHASGTIMDGKETHLDVKDIVRPAVNRRFDIAWLLHQHRNSHHWQHWVLREDSGAVKVLEMPEKYLREMVADWMGAGKAITGRWEVAEWYAKNRAKITMGPQTRVCVDEIIDDIANKMHQKDLVDTKNNAA